MQPQNASAYVVPSRPTRCCVRRLRVPAETVLTPMVLIGAARRLPDAELGAVIDALIAETDARARDPDLEDDADREPDDDL